MERRAPGAAGRGDGSRGPPWGFTARGAGPGSVGVTLPGARGAFLGSSKLPRCLVLRRPWFRLSAVSAQRGGHRRPNASAVFGPISPPAGSSWTPEYVLEGEHPHFLVGVLSFLRPLRGRARWRIRKAAFPSVLLLDRAPRPRPFRGSGNVLAPGEPGVRGPASPPTSVLGHIWEELLLPHSVARGSRPRWLVDPCSSGGAAARREPPQGAVGTGREPGVTDGALEAAEFPQSRA